MTIPSIFISHSSIDDEWCKCLFQLLRDAGYDIWYDAKSLRGGDTWMEVIEKELQERTVFMVILTPAALQSPWVRREIQLAISKQRTIIRVQHKATEIDGFLSLEPIVIDAIGLSCTAAAEQVIADLRRRYGTVQLSNSVPNLSEIKIVPFKNGKRRRRRIEQVVLTWAVTSLLLISTIWFALSKLSASVATVDSTVYGILGDGSMIAINASDGKPRWSLQAPNGDHLFPLGTLSNGVIYIPSLNHTLYAIETSHGKQLWSYQIGDSGTAPTVVAGGSVYVVLNHSVDALHVKDGTLLRRYQVGNDNSFTPNAIAVANGLLYITASDYVPDPTPGQCQQQGGCVGTTGSGGTMYAFKISDGSLLWYKHTDAGGYGVPTVMNGVVYVADSTSIISLRGDNGQQIWRAPSNRLIPSMAISNGLLCCSEGHDDSGYFISALTITDGGTLWKYPIPSFLMPTMTLLDGVIYLCACESSGFAHDWGLRALQATSGKSLWLFPRNRISYGYVHIAYKETAYFSSHDDGDVHAYIDAVRVKDGSLAWSRRTIGLTDPTLAGGMLYAGIVSPISDPNLYAIRADNGALAWRYQAKTNVQLAVVGP